MNRSRQIIRPEGLLCGLSHRGRSPRDPPRLRTYAPDRPMHPRESRVTNTECAPHRPHPIATAELRTAAQLPGDSPRAGTRRARASVTQLLHAGARKTGIPITGGPSDPQGKAAPALGTEGSRHRGEPSLLQKAARKTCPLSEGHSWLNGSRGAGTGLSGLSLLYTSHFFVS